MQSGLSAYRSVKGSDRDDPSLTRSTDQEKSAAAGSGYIPTTMVPHVRSGVRYGRIDNL